MPQRTRRPYIDHPALNDRASYIELLRAELPPLPPAPHVELLDTEDQKRHAKTLPRDESERAFLLFNAARRRLHTMRRDSRRHRWADRVRHCEDFLVRHNAPLVPYAFHIYRRKDPGVVYDAHGAFSEGMGGLLRAVRGFDVGKGWLFSTYAVRVILNHFASFRLLAAKRANRLPTCNLTDDRGREIVAAPDAHNEVAEQRESLYAALRSNSAGLTQAELVVVSRFLGNEKRTLEEVGTQIGCSKERVRQIQVSAIRKLRAVLVEAE